MAVIKTKGDFDFLYQTPTYKKIDCWFKDGRKSVIDFDRLQINYLGVVKVWAESEQKFVSSSQILPENQEDEAYFLFITKELDAISLKRKHELKIQKKQKNDRQKMII